MKYFNKNKILQDLNVSVLAMKCIQSYFSELENNKMFWLA